MIVGIEEKVKEASEMDAMLEAALEFLDKVAVVEGTSELMMMEESKELLEAMGFDEGDITLTEDSEFYEELLDEGFKSSFGKYFGRMIGKGSAKGTEVAVPDTGGFAVERAASKAAGEQAKAPKKSIANRLIDYAMKPMRKAVGEGAKDAGDQAAEGAKENIKEWKKEIETKVQDAKSEALRKAYFLGGASLVGTAASSAILYDKNKLIEDSKSFVKQVQFLRNSATGNSGELKIQETSIRKKIGLFIRFFIEGLVIAISSALLGGAFALISFPLAVAVAVLVPIIASMLTTMKRGEAVSVMVNNEIKDFDRFMKSTSGKQLSRIQKKSLTKSRDNLMELQRRLVTG